MSSGSTLPVWASVILAAALIGDGTWRALYPSQSRLETDMNRLRYESTSRYGRFRVPERAWGILAIVAGLSILARELL